MDREQKNKIKEPGLLEQLFPTEIGLMQSLSESKTLIIMLVVILTLFGGLGLFLLKIST
jgi:LPS O-antigen subunit length determinant protein (WzzB/FepE family)